MKYFTNRVKDVRVSLLFHVSHHLQFIFLHALSILAFINITN